MQDVRNVCVCGIMPQLGAGTCIGYVGKLWFVRSLSSWREINPRPSQWMLVCACVCVRLCVRVCVYVCQPLRNYFILSHHNCLRMRASGNLYIGNYIGRKKLSSWCAAVKHVSDWMTSEARFRLSHFCSCGDTQKVNTVWVPLTKKLMNHFCLWDANGAKTKKQLPSKSFHKVSL